jgi:hypothetical protein
LVELNNPFLERQESHGTCGADFIVSAFYEQFPAEAARVHRGLLLEGMAEVENGEVLTEVVGSRSKDARSLSGRTLQKSLMQFANLYPMHGYPDNHTEYINVAGRPLYSDVLDRQVKIDRSEILLLTTGLDVRQTKRIYQGLFGIRPLIVPAAFLSQEDLEELASKPRIGAIGVRFSTSFNSDEGHMVRLLQVPPAMEGSNDLIRFHNTAAVYDVQDGKEIEKGRVLIDGKNQIQGFTRAAFWQRATHFIIPPEKPAAYSNGMSVSVVER